MTKPVEEEVKALIRFYERRGWSWACAAEFVLAKHSGRLDLPDERNYIIIPKPHLRKEQAWKTQAAGQD